jgi:thermopsin
MTSWTKALMVLAVGIAVFCLVPSQNGLASAHPEPIELSPTGATEVAAASTGSGALAQSSHLLAGTMAAIQANNIPRTDVFLPNFNAAPSVSGGIVHPGYVSAPAPMGLGYFGVQERHGVDVGTISYTGSVEATVALNSVDPFYLASSSPDIFTMQLNTVLTHVTVLGNHEGTYWIQNVPLYYADSQTLSIEDNIWNFTAPGAGMQLNTLYSYDGNLVAPEFYYAVGPSWHVPTPFTIRLYNNATVFNDRPTMFFNYSITTSTGSVISGSYDQVEFNSAVHSPPLHAAPRPTFQINGQQTNAFGLLNDAEIMLGGPGGGSTTTLLGINATMALSTLPNGSASYVSVPAGYSFGTDTGETSEGIAEWTPGGSNPVAVLGTGPSLLQPLWGLVGAHSGYIQDSFAVSPSNAFVFVSPGKAFHPDAAAWAPLPPSGMGVYRLTPGMYSYKFLLSEYAPSTITLSGSVAMTLTLASDPALGVYTPLWAWDNSQLASISAPGGTGTLHHPYVLDNLGLGPVSPLFGEFNDYYFPVFPGLLIANTNAYVTATGLTDFPVTYSLPAEGLFSGHFGTPYTNNLDLQFYNATHVSLVDNPVLTGWQFAEDPYISSVLFWNSSDNLIAGNDFQVQSTGLILTGGTHNILWGNEFVSATTTAANAGTILIYNNAFETPMTAETAPFNFYTGAFQVWTDRWNVMPQPASNWRSVNGWNLTGSILGLSEVAGNYWANYGTASDPYGVLPYDNGEFITNGGDRAPILPYPLFKVTFTEKTLPSGTLWSISIDGYTQLTTGTALVFWEPSGLYAYTVGVTSGYTANPAVGAVQVSGANTHVGVVFS